MMPSNALWVSLPIPTLMLDGSDRIVQSNPAAESFLNVSARALEGAPIWTKLICDASLHDAYARAREGRTSLSVNNVEIGVSPEATPCNVEVAPLSGDTDLMLVMIVPREINGRMVQQSGAGKAAKSAIGMAEMLAHEIKNPLAGITGAAQLVAMNLTAQDQELTDLIVAECRRIVALLDQVEHF